MPLSGCVCRLATAERGATEKQTLNNLENREGQHWGWGWGWRVFEGGGNRRFEVSKWYCWFERAVNTPTYVVCFVYVEPQRYAFVTMVTLLFLYILVSCVAVLAQQWWQDGGHIWHMVVSSRPHRCCSTFIHNLKEHKLAHKCESCECHHAGYESLAWGAMMRMMRIMKMMLGPGVKWIEKMDQIIFSYKLEVK